MFEQSKGSEQVAAEDTGRSGKVTVAACGPNWSAVVVGRRVVYTFSLGSGLKPLHSVCPLPMFGRVVAVGQGPSVVLEDGSHLVWVREGRWERQPVADTEGA